MTELQRSEYIETQHIHKYRAQMLFTSLERLYEQNTGRGEQMTLYHGNTKVILYNHLNNGNITHDA